MKFGISRKIVFIAAAGVVVSSVTILCISTILMSRLLDRNIQDDMLAMRAVVERMQKNEKLRLSHDIRILAGMPELVNAVDAKDKQKIKEIARQFMLQLGVDAVAVTDENGIVLGRGHSQRIGEDLSERSTMKAALRGEIKPGILFDKNAIIPFTIRCDAPIRKEGRTVGFISLANDIGSEEYVDNLQNVTGMHFTLFKGDTRYTTTLKNSNGNRVVNSSFDNAQIINAVQKQGEAAIERVKKFGELYMAVYWPVKDIDGRIIGMWAIAKSLKKQNAEISNVLTIVIFCSLGIMIVIVLTAILFGNRIALPIRKATGFAVQVAQGNLDVSLEVKSNDEAGLLVCALRSMVSTLKKRISDAEIANKAKSSFLSTMSHEIRTPMNAILGITEIQLQNETIDQSVREGLERIYASGDMLLSIINDILDLSKIEAGKLELQIGKYEIASLISDTAQLNMMRIGSKPIEFKINVDENIPAHLLGDELRVKQIFNNLLSNAFKYTAAGKVTMSVSSQAGKNADEMILAVTVRDTGQGMTKEQINTLFDEYARFNKETNRSTEGTGLGMSITNNLLRLMNGEISVESEQGKGSVFFVRIPQGKTDSEVLGKEMAENLHLFRTHSRAQMKRAQITREPMPYGKILIVDDVETNIYVAKGLMAQYELQIDSANSGFEALDKIKSGNVYDIIFMDHMMPKMDGIVTTKLIREYGYNHPVVALTANAVAGQADIFLKNGFDDFLSKPIDIRQLNLVLNKLIRDKQPPEIIGEARLSVKAKNGQESAAVPEQEINLRIFEAILRDSKRILTALDAFIEKGEPYNEEELRLYTIHTHGIKSVLANIGKTELSDVALKLETLGRDKNIEAITAQTPAFLTSLRTIVEELEEKADNKRTGETEDDKPFLREKLLIIKSACEEYDEVTAGEALKELQNKTWTPPVKKFLSEISEKLLHSDFDEAAAAAEKYTVNL
ncbi:MAG: ATP-binding protein [Chitinispirillia bacterium]|nr:ATP-binding protein [Chitinispirillia bacterium]